MAYVAVKFAPSVLGVEDSTPLGAEGFFIDADKVRFYRGHAQTIGGWEKKSSEPGLRRPEERAYLGRP